MNRKLILCRGLPGSGKSTWAKEQLEKHPDLYKRVNRDELRTMIDGGAWSKKREKLIKEAEQQLANIFLAQGYSVIADDTNLSNAALMLWDRFAAQHSVELQVQDFTQVPLEVCLERNQKRPYPVPERVIKRMWRDHLAPLIEKPKYIKDASNIVLFDLDGTLAIMGDRSPYDWKACARDALNEPVAHLLRTYARDPYMGIIILSGRSEVCRKETLEWLETNDIYFDALFMRQEGDNRKDAIIKRELYEQEIQGKYNILFVCDDRQQCVDLWRSLGLTVFQVNYGDF